MTKPNRKNRLMLQNDVAEVKAQRKKIDELLNPTDPLQKLIMDRVKARLKDDYDKEVERVLFFGNGKGISIKNISNHLKELSSQENGIEQP